MYFQLLSVALVVICAVASPSIKPSEITQQDVDIAIERISTELLNRFDEKRGWEPDSKTTGWLSKGLGGTTAVATLALLSANQSQHTSIMKIALKQVESVKKPSTYVSALRTMVYCKLAETHEKQLKDSAKRLVETMGKASGGWGYYSVPPRTVDTASPIIRRFATVALLEAHRKGVRIPSACFGSIAEAILYTQNNDGGWSHAQEKTASNTTIAGFNCLLSVDEVLGDALSDAQHKTINIALQKALDWLNTHYAPKLNTGGTAMMSYLCGLERAAMSCGLDQLDNSDWYREGVAAVLKAHCSSKKHVKGSDVNLSFALLFLTRGRIPLSLVELRTDKTTLDPYRLARKISSTISNQIEQTLGWRVVTEIDEVYRWLQAPLLLIQYPEAIPNDLEKLSHYLDRGGLLVLFGDKKNAQHFSNVARQLCPDATHSVTRKEHWALTLIQNAKGIQIESWHDGIRDRIILVQSDPRKYPEQKTTQLSKALINICCGAAELSKWNTRLWDQKNGLVAKYFVLASHAGKWDFESHGLRLIGIKSKLLTAIAGPSVVLVGGISEEEATEQIANDIISTAKAGSIVLVEPIGGLGEFSSRLRLLIGKQLSTLIEPDRNLVKKIQPIGIRGFTQFKRLPLAPPLVVQVGDGQIIFLDGDIRNALLGQPSWGVHGYDATTSAALMCVLAERIK